MKLICFIILSHEKFLAMNNGFDQSQRNLRCMGCNMNFMGQTARQFVFYEQSTAQLVDSLSNIFPDVEPYFISCGFCEPGSQPETLPGRIVPANMPVLVENPKPAIDLKKVFEEAAEDEGSSSSSNKVTPKKTKPKKSNKSKNLSKKKKLKKSF